MSETETIVDCCRDAFQSTRQSGVIEHLRSGNEIEAEPDNPKGRERCEGVCSGWSEGNRPKGSRRNRVQTCRDELCSKTLADDPLACCFGHPCGGEWKAAAQAQGKAEQSGTSACVRAIDESGLSMEEAEASPVCPDGKPLVMIKLPVEV